MTTIDHQQAAEAVQGAILGINVLTAERALTAAAPHLRAAWEQPIRELHKPVPMVPGLDDTPVCDGCENPGRFVPYPCPTIQALDEKGTHS